MTTELLLESSRLSSSDVSTISQISETRAASSQSSSNDNEVEQSGDHDSEDVLITSWLLVELIGDNRHHFEITLVNKTEKKLFLLVRKILRKQIITKKTRTTDL